MNKERLKSRMIEIRRQRASLALRVAELHGERAMIEFKLSQLAAQDAEFEQEAAKVRIAYTYERTTQQDND